jgi:hypothetical protein
MTFVSDVVEPEVVGLARCRRTDIVYLPEIGPPVLLSARLTLGLPDSGVVQISGDS